MKDRQLRGGDNTYGKHHALVFYFALGPYVEAERPIDISLGGRIPPKTGNANLKCDKLSHYRP